MTFVIPFTQYNWEVMQYLFQYKLLQSNEKYYNFIGFMDIEIEDYVLSLNWQNYGKFKLMGKSYRISFLR